MRTVISYASRYEDHFRAVMEQKLQLSSEAAIRGHKKRLAQAEKRLTELDRLFIRIYEDAIVLGGIWGTTAMFIRYRLPSVPLLLGCYALCTGIFVGVLAMALTEVLNVIPILLRRTRLTKGLPWLILAFALGKVCGSLVYFLVDGFYVL